MNTQEKETEEEFIAKLKKANPEIRYQLGFTEDGIDYKCYLKEVDRATLEQAMGLVSKTRGNPEMIRAGEVILTACWVTGDEAIRKDDKLLVPMCIQAFEVMDLKETYLKKI